MKIIFFGSSQFGEPSLRAIVENNYKVICVVTQPDRKKARGLKSLPTPIKQVAMDLGFLVYQPERINTVEAVNFLKDLNADLFVVIAYGQILSEEILNIPKIFSLNVHASLLPKYRGAAPVNWAIIKGEKTTGITIIKMTEKMDAGPIIFQESIDILEQDDAVSLGQKLSLLSARLLIKTLRDIQKNNYQFIPQDEAKVCFAPRLKKEDGRINWDEPAIKINNLIRGCMGWPGAFTYYKGRRLKIYKAK
ncbi:MAG: methionyl-tRNA formyltransferase, partial [Candidatus Omnitrophica bacterium]|nr:methionyl-tRNA formyltransferase [Candidatus Omnitrophota bacterium]